MGVSEWQARDPGLPIKLGPCSNGEFDPAPLSPIAEAAVGRAREACNRNARRLGVSRRQFLLSLCGAATTLLVNLDVILPWVLAFFAGSFIYIGASDLLPEAREHDSPWVGVATAVGMLAIYVTTRILRGL